jgi:hypothetical protein
MIEMRIIDNGPICRPDFQYRYHIFTTDISGGLCPPSIYESELWSDWKTAEWVKQND